MVEESQHSGDKAGFGDSHRHNRVWLMRGLSYTQRTLRFLREQGLLVDKVELWNPYAGKFGCRKDLFGLFDLLCVGPEGIIGVQSTSGGQHSQHRRAMLENENLPEWLKAGGKAWLISWRKKFLKRGGKARRWVPRIETFRIGGDGLPEAVKMEHFALSCARFAPE